MKEESLKWTGFIVSGIILFLSPIIGTLIFVGFLVTADWITGVLKSIKNKDFQSNIAIRKLWVSTGYLFAILTARAVEMYYNDAIPAVMPTVGIIALAEIQSLRENILALTNIDIFKFIIKAFDKK
jgi:hypothetical protein